MNILGICDSQDAGAVLFDTVNNSFTAVNEERLCRIKLKGGFPKESIREVLKLKNLEASDIDVVAIASYMTPSCVFRAIPEIHENLRKGRKQFSLLLSIYILYQVFAHKTKIAEYLESWLSKIIIRWKLKKIGIKSKVVIIEHHSAHAYAAYATSGTNKALIFTIDGLGDGVAFTVNIGEGGKVKRIYEQSAFCGITLYYSRLTEFLGFLPIQDEGKVMGLAGYSSEYPVLAQARKLLGITAKGFKYRNIFFNFSKDKKVFNGLKNRKKEEIAASFQFYLEQKLGEIVRYWARKTQIYDVVLGGGFFANIKVNQKIAELEEVKSVYVYPHMGDGGLALGAACALKKIKPFFLKSIFWGPSFTNEYIGSLLKKSAFKYEFIEDIEAHTALLLSRGYIVGRLCGAMEYGPRALGNRSILCQATNTKIHGLLNNKLKRDTFMPFAPAILAEFAPLCCEGAEKAEYSAKFMNMSFKCTEYFKKICPAAIHVDGTTRPQFVCEDSGSFYKILSEYKKITGIPALINTSFNIHEEPIVCRPEEAIKTFIEGNLDYLVLENFLIKGGNNE
ncbi:MAG: hypothetical protein HY810_07005 [Candidatus Omnitrophica bacterium]|nr:hypothetical protein [Candidatus Omnitrophota bacterium]